MKTRRWALLCALFLVAAACGGSDDPDAELIAALEASINNDDDPFDGLEMDAKCAATSLVDAVGGAEQAESKYGITTASVEADPEFDAELSQQDAEAFVDGFWDCGDMEGALVLGLTEDGTLSEENARCLVGNVDTDLFKTSLAAEFMSDEAGAAMAESADEESFQQMFDAMTECGIDLGS